jgi:predicted permease
MEALGTALNAVLPAFLLIATGALVDRQFPGLHLQTLTRLSVQILIPALVLTALAGTDLTLAGAARLSLGYLLYLVFLGSLAWWGSYGLGPRVRRGVVTTSVFGNTGNMGLPITLFAYGVAGLERAVVLLVLSLVAMFALGPAMLAPGMGGIGQRLQEVLRLPPLWATLAGVVLNFSPWSLPTSLDRSFELLGNAAIPVMLLSLGMQMNRSWGQTEQQLAPGGPALRSTFLRLLLGPVVALALASLLGLDGLDLRVLVLSAAMPAAVTMFVVAVEVGGDAAGVGRAVALQTFGSVLAIVAVLLHLPPV